MMHGWGPVAVAVTGAVFTGACGGLLTRIDEWYRGLRKPSWQPPDWLFGPVWTIILGLAAWSAVLAWHHAADVPGRTLVVGLFMANIAANVGWSYFFFFSRRPDRALIEVGFLWLTIAALIGSLAAMSPLASLLLVPYLLWVSFAAYLNRTIVRLNGRFA